MRTKGFVYQIVLLGLLLWAPQSSAINFETLVMPGPLTKNHAKFEEKCENCHTSFKKESQNKFCLDCHDHKNIKDDIQAKKGFHGRIKNASTKECKTCHSDHKGRDEDIMRLDPLNFNHRMTDFRLKGAHLKASCNACHTSGKPHREAPHNCIDCHKADDRHQGKLGDKCADCHSEQSWRQQEVFDHSKTDFPLKGHHKKVKCNLCHADEHYKDTPKACISCHKINDTHQGRYGKKCQSCHTERDWKKVKFRHNRDTKYRLTGAHKKVQCDTCHTGPKLYSKKKRKQTCNSCHKLDDVHKGRNGVKCQDCHTTKSWSGTDFNHDKDTKFPLNGKHSDLACEGCHKGGVFEEQLKAECYACHKTQDVHRGQQGKQCQECHNEKGWDNELFFDHDITPFPLIGQHAVAPCEECHISNEYQDASSKCNDCHEQDDEKHKGRLGDNCAQCHNPNDWKAWIFDHNKNTDYKLEGIHDKLDCHLCHRRAPIGGKIRLAHDCYSCHQSDDIHRGNFGRHCDRCHTGDTFSDIELQ
ncbi:MAG: cytochrome c3 family protein [Gammaproteobacteria bacterium]|nr:cytochrome c3 family protein [Gammaproteobacteria bacterium]